MHSRMQTVAAATASIIASGIDASERSRLEAERRHLEAEASASLAMHRKVMARLEAEREEWGREKATLEAALASGRDELLERQREARQKQLELRKLGAEAAEARAEAGRLKAEKEMLLTQLEGGSGADQDDHLALQQDLQGKLAESEKHRVEVSRKMARTHKRQENMLAQFEAEVELLSEKVRSGCFASPHAPPRPAPSTPPH